MLVLSFLNGVTSGVKKTWITEPYIIPYDRNALWHNAVDPEQNYGIYAMESDGPRSLPSCH